MRIRIEPYKRWSGGAKALGNRCGILRATPRQVEKHGDFETIINWGNSQRRFNGRYINEPEACSLASDKKACLEILAAEEIPCPPFTSEKVLAEEWLSNGISVVARTLLRANSGRGIVLCTPENGQAVPQAPLYTQYIKKAEEYRIHVVQGSVVDQQLKRRRLEVPDDEVDFQIRNASNGWVFTREGVAAPDCVLQASINAVNALGLDFGAVDVGYNIKYNAPCVFEVNTAPGLEGTTLENYYEAFLKMLPAIKGGMYRKRRLNHV